MKKIIIICVVIISNIISFEIYAQGELLIFPKRVVFEDNQTKSVITLLNTSEKSSTYSVSFVQKKMSEAGALKNITIPDEGQMFADAHLRIYPRQVTLMPGESQAVMIQRSRKKNLLTGEYRSHLYFRAEVKNTPIEFKEKDSINSLSFSITPIYGISIPIIFHSGEVSVVNSLSDLKLENLEDATLSFVIHRKGNISTYGDLIVEYYPVKGKPLTVAILRGIALYTTIDKRYISLKLASLPEMNLNKGVLKIKYVSRPGTKEQVFAEEKLTLIN
jgi:hypothetical protein